MNYEELLERAKAKLPKGIERIERFELPKVTGHIEGNKTIVSNFLQVCSILNREPSHLLKFLQKELATPGEIEGSRLILGRKISSAAINSKVELYAKEFVLCRECKKPDTQLKRENKILMLKCMACGAKYPIKTRI